MNSSQEIKPENREIALRTVPTNGNYFFPDNDYVRQVDHIRGY